MIQDVVPDCLNPAFRRSPAKCINFFSEDSDIVVLHHMVSTSQLRNVRGGLHYCSQLTFSADITAVYIATL